MSENLRKQLINQINNLPDNDRLLSKVLSYLKDYNGADPLRRSIYKENVAKNIKKNINIIVPIVCDDMFEYIRDDGMVVSIQEYISTQYTEQEDLVEAIRNNYYYGISRLEKEENETFANTLYKDIGECIKEGRIRLNQSAKTFLRNGNFPLIVTTLGFPVIEGELNLEKESSVWYNPNRRNDLPIVNNVVSTKVYHIFGGETYSSWVYNEQTLLKFMHSLHSEDYGAKNLFRLLRKHGNVDAKRLLVMGASLPNWLFRFFIYPMFEEDLKNVKGYWLSLYDIETELDFFLKQNNYTGLTNLKMENRIDNVIAEATCECGQHNHKEVRRPNIFISYKRENDNKAKADIINRVVSILQNQGVVWLDTERVSDGGNPYWAEIKNAVKYCDIFVPIVTSRYMEEYISACDISEIPSKEPLSDADSENANDGPIVETLKPVLREAYYAIAYKKKCAPIIILDENENLNPGIVESIAKSDTDPHNLPRCIFAEHTILQHDDNFPVFFNLPSIV